MKAVIFNQRLTLEGERLMASQLQEDTSYEGCQILGDMDRMKFRCMRFKRCDFGQCTFEKAELLDVIFENCDFSNQAFDDAYIYRAVFHDCKLYATALYRCAIKDVLFKGCMMHYLNFSADKVESVRFESCDCLDASFQNVKHKAWVFKDVMLNRASFMETNMKGIDLRWCEFDAIFYTPALVKGLVVRADHAVSLIGQFGILVD